MRQSNELPVNEGNASVTASFGNIHVPSGPPPGMTPEPSLYDEKDNIRALFSIYEPVCRVYCEASYVSDLELI